MGGGFDEKDLADPIAPEKERKKVREVELRKATPGPFLGNEHAGEEGE